MTQRTKRLIAVAWTIACIALVAGAQSQQLTAAAKWVRETLASTPSAESSAAGASVQHATPTAPPSPILGKSQAMTSPAAGGDTE
jgi:hypothetical protein